MIKEEFSDLLTVYPEIDFKHQKIQALGGLLEEHFYFYTHIRIKRNEIFYLIPFKMSYVAISQDLNVERVNNIYSKLHSDIYLCQQLYKVDENFNSVNDAGIYYGIYKDKQTISEEERLEQKFKIR